MDANVANGQKNGSFSDLLKARPIPVSEALDWIKNSTDNGTRTNQASSLLQALSKAQDFDGTYAAVKACYPYLPAGLFSTQIRDNLAVACKNRLEKAFLAAADFGGKRVKIEESIRRFDLLRSLKIGSQIIDRAWGFGTVKRIDDFYNKVTIDFSGKPNHGLTFATVCETVKHAPADHLYTRYHNNPAEIKAMIQDAPEQLVILTLSSLGNMPVQRLEATLEKIGILQASDWKKFWDAARRGLHAEKRVVIPARRADSIVLLEQVESYGEKWFDSFAKNRDALDILRQINEVEDFRNEKRAKAQKEAEITGEAVNVSLFTDEERAVIQNRLAFAATGARNTNPALFARIAARISALGFSEPSIESLRDHLWEDQRYLIASRDLTAKDNFAMCQFLLSAGKAPDPDEEAAQESSTEEVPVTPDTEHAEAVRTLLNDLPEMPYSLLNDVLNALKDMPECQAHCLQLINQTKAPHTLIVWLFRNYDKLQWQVMPKLSDLLGHAVAMIETSLTGEDLRMQNYISEFFDNQSWLEGLMKKLSEEERIFFFERIQASHAWDPSSHRTLLGRLVEIDNSLAKFRKAAKKTTQNLTRWTSWRSMKEHQNAYTHLVEVEMPKNSHDIAVARGYGDLRENFEYQAAKDLQRQLIQRQQEMQKELKMVKGTDFASASTEKVGPGTSVTLRTADGTVLSYTILGEWDSDETLNIISDRTRMAQALDGKTAGETVTIPSADGNTTATIEKIAPISDAVKAWIESDPPPVA